MSSLSISSEARQIAGCSRSTQRVNGQARKAKYSKGRVEVWCGHFTGEYDDVCMNRHDGGRMRLRSRKKRRNQD